MALPRRLHFVVGTSLLGASLSIGCTGKPAIDEKPDATEKKPTEPEAPVETIRDGPNANEGPKPEPIPVTNEGPQVEPPPEVIAVNPGPEPIEEKRVNTRPSEK